MNQSLYEFDAMMREKHGVLCGVDEAGRGPLCGPVSVAAVILNPEEIPQGLNDSKKLSEKKRKILYDEIIKTALAYHVELVSPELIDTHNILGATLFGMQKAVSCLSIQAQYVLIDGNRLPELSIPCEAVIQGDAKSASIAAASILAKVTRDEYMKELAKQFPEYRLEQHKGYPTKLHYELLDQYGIQPFYRKTFLKKRGYVK